MFWVLLGLKLGIIVGCSFLFQWGGSGFLAARRYIMPAILAISCALFTHSWWALTMVACMGCFTLGYGDNSKFGHIFGDGWGRGVWGLLGGIALSLGLFLSGHLNWIAFASYLGVNFILEDALKDLPQPIGDKIIGAGFSYIVLLV